MEIIDAPNYNTIELEDTEINVGSDNTDTGIFTIIGTFLNHGQINMSYGNIEKILLTVEKETLLAELVSACVNGKIGFPYKKLFVQKTPQNMFTALIQHKTVIKTITTPPLLVSSCKHLMPGKINIVMHPSADYDEIDLICDLFQEPARMRACRYDEKMSPADAWKNAERSRELFDKLILSRLDINTRNLREYLYKTTKECTQFKPTLAKYVMEKYGSGENGSKTRVLDISAGWGDRLIGAIAANVQKYSAFDPNVSLRQGHNEIIATLGDGNKERFHIEYVPFEEGVIKGTYNLVFTSPPFFDLEKYVPDDSPERANQSISRYPSRDEWFGGFLFVALKKAWDVLDEGGAMVLHISDANNIHIVEAMNMFIQTRLQFAQFETVFGSGIAARPLWVYRKMSAPSKDVERVEKMFAHKYPHLSKITL